MCKQNYINDEESIMYVCSIVVGRSCNCSNTINLIRKVHTWATYLDSPSTWDNERASNIKKCHEMKKYHLGLCSWK